MPDDLIQNIIQHSTSEQERPRQRRFNPLLLSTVLLAVALAAALLGLIFQQQRFQDGLAAANAAHQQELQAAVSESDAANAALEDQLDTLTKETLQAQNLLKDTQQELELLTGRYQVLYAQSEGVRLAEFIIELHEQGRSDLAAEMLRSMVLSTQQYCLSQSMYTVPNQSGSLNVIFVYSTRTRLLAVAEQLLDQGLLTGEEVDYVRSLFEYHHITESGAVSPTPDQ